jgi:hypothetical protein
MSLFSNIAGTVVGGPAGLALSVLGSARKGISRAWGWITASSTHLLVVALVGVAIWGWFGHHEEAKYKRIAEHEKAGRQADNRIWASADKINHRSIDKLLAAVTKQNAAVQGWADSAKAKQKAATKALEAATERGKASEALALRIDAEAAQRAPSGAQCKSGAAVIAAKNDL